MSLEEERDGSRKVLEQGFLRHFLRVLWQSAALASLMVLTNYVLRPKAFDFEGVWVTFALCFVGFSIVTFSALLVAAVKYRPSRKSSKIKHDL
jgi:hypothetical protein